MPVNLFKHYDMTWLPNIKNSKKPLYITIAEQLETDIKKGVLTPGTKLPPQRDLANYLDINLSTVSRAFKLCIQKGIICATIGNGTFVSSDVNSNHFLLPSNVSSKLIEFGSMFPESESNDEVAEQLKKMTFEPNFKMLFDYGRPDGTPLQKEAAKKYIARMGYEVKSESILFAGGGQNSIAACLAGLFKPGDRIGTNRFIYPGLKTVAAMFGIQLIPIKQKGEEITRESLLYACRNENIKGLYLIPDYSNPTSHTISRETRKMIGETAADENLIIIEDGSFSFMREKPMLPLAYFAPENTVYISNLSKVIAPGLRLAFVTVPQRFKRAMSIALYNLNISLSPLMIELVSRLINSGVAEKITKLKRENTNERNRIINRVLDSYDVRGDENCIFRWLILPEKFSGEDFEKRAYERGVQVYASERFVVGNTKPVGAVRLAVGSPKNENELMEGLKIIKSLLEE